MINKNQLKEIITDLSEVCNELNIRVSDETLLRESATYQIGLLANENRNTPKVKSSQVGGSDLSGGEVGDKSDKPTQKQLAYLQKHKVKIPKDLTKQEAKEMISTFIKNQQKEFI